MKEASPTTARTGDCVKGRVSKPQDQRPQLQSAGKKGGCFGNSPKKNQYRNWVGVPTTKKKDPQKKKNWKKGNFQAGASEAGGGVTGEQQRGNGVGAGERFFTLVTREKRNKRSKNKEGRSGDWTFHQVKTGPQAAG